MPPSVARADRLPLAEIAGSWSSRGGPAATLWVAQPTRVKVLALHVDAGISLNRVGLDPNASAPAPFIEGVAPSHVGVGVALRHAWFQPHFTGFVLGAIDLGVADAEWVGYGTARAIVDLDYVRLHGALWIFADARVSTTYELGIVIRPYIRFLELMWDCSSQDGSNQEPRKPCGPGAALHFMLPATPVDLRVGARITFHDLRGVSGATGQNVFAVASIYR